MGDAATSAAAPAKAQQLYIDITRLLARGLRGRRPTGVDRVGLAYVAHFAPRAAALLRLGPCMLTLTPAASQRLFASLLAHAHQPRALLAALAGALAGLRGSARLRGALLFNTGHSGLERPGYGAALQRLQVRPVFVLHDLIPITHPEYCRAGEQARHVRRIDTMLACAAALVANSHATLDALQRYLPARAGSLQRPLPPAVAAWLAPAALPAPAPGRPMAAPYFVVLGTLEARKNLVTLLQVWRSLSERMGAAAPHLVIIGQRGWECENVLDLLERCPAIAGTVSEVGACSDARLAGWLSHAQALLFPSFAEGYGLPLVEALACGVPVIASDLPVFREIAGNIPDYLDPLDGLGWLELVAEYSVSGSLRRAAQCRRLADFRPPDWAGHFRRVEHLLEQLA